MFNFRTDLAVERREIFKKANKIEDEIEGIETEEENDISGIVTTRVKILNENRSKCTRKAYRKLYYNRH